MTENKRFKIAAFCLFVFAAFALNLYLAEALASFQVTSFSCSPSESVINSVFSCSATIKNVGDAAGSVTTATLYPDSNDWLEESNYAQASGTSVNPGQTTEVIFSSLRATKSGNNGFLKIMLDSVTDTYVADNNVKANIINVAVGVSNSASSANMNANFDSTAEVTAGGNIDVTLTFTVDSGGCSIGTQPNQKSISGMQDGNKQSRTWTVTQGTSGNCRFTISAAATGTGGVATKSDSLASTVTCTDCPSGGSSTSGGSSSSGGSLGAKTYTLGQLNSAQIVELSDGDKANFNILNEAHTLTLESHTDTAATISIESEKQTFTLSVGDERNVDFNNDDIDDIAVKLKSINIITKKATLVITPLIEEEGGGGGITGGAITGEETIAGIKKSKFLFIAIIFFIVLAVLSGVAYYYSRKKRKNLWGEK